MAFRKEIIILSGGKNKGVLKLHSAVGKSGILKGNCTLDFIPKNAALYIVGDTAHEIALTGTDTSFEIPDGQLSAACVVASGDPVMFGTLSGGLSFNQTVARVEKFRKEKVEKQRYETKKEKNPEPVKNIVSQDKDDPNASEKIKEKEKQKDSREESLSEEGTDKSTEEDVKDKTDKELVDDALEDNAENYFSSEEPAEESAENPEKRGNDELGDFKFNDEKDFKSETEAARNASRYNREQPINRPKAGAFAAESEGAAFSDTAFLFDESVRFDGENFYLAIKPQLDEMFVCYPSEEDLDKVVPNSKWVRVDAEEDYYVVGVLYDIDAPSFICYGIPGSYSVKPPAEIEELCVWLPKKLDEKYGDGYWVIYQSATDGKIVK